MMLFLFFKEIHNRTLKDIKMTLAILRLDHSMLFINKANSEKQRTDTVLITIEPIVKEEDRF